MKRRILALLLVLVTVLGMLPATAQAASSEEEALGEINIYSDGTELDYLSINGAARTQKYTYYNYVDKEGATNEIPCYCVNPNTKGVPQSVPAGTGIEYLANQKCTDTKVLGIVASGYPHRTLEALGLNSKYEAYYATKMALWCHLLSNWSVYDLKVNPGCSDQAAAQRVLKAAKEIYQTGMYWTKPLSPKLTATPDQANPYPVTIDGKAYMQQVYKVVSETWVDGGWVHVDFTDPSSVPTGTRIIDKDGNDCTQISCMENTGSGFAGQFTILIPQESMDEGDGSVQVEISGVGHNYAKLIALANACVGWMRGGLAMVNIVASYFFGGISGSAAADTASIGSIMIPMMVDQGYDDDFSTAVTITSSCEGLLVPPSHNMVIYSMTAGSLSVGSLFLAGYLPGAILAIALMVGSYIISVKRNYPKGEKFRLGTFFRQLGTSIWALAAIVIVIVGVVTGKFTATESVAIAVIYSLFVSVFVYKGLDWKGVWKALDECVNTLAKARTYRKPAFVY